MEREREREINDTEERRRIARADTELVVGIGASAQMKGFARERRTVICLLSQEGRESL